MHQTHPKTSESLRAIAPWIGATMALLVAVILLSRFIDTLHMSIQRGHDWRAAVHTPATTDRHTDALLAEAGTWQQPALR